MILSMMVIRDDYIYMLTWCLMDATVNDRENPRPLLMTKQEQTTCELEMWCTHHYNKACHATLWHRTIFYLYSTEQSMYSGTFYHSKL
jgi:hypothetical protein